jgi:hypothetical protein
MRSPVSVVGAVQPKAASSALHARQAIDLRAHDPAEKLACALRQFQRPKHEAAGLQHQLDTRLAQQRCYFRRQGLGEPSLAEIQLFALAGQRAIRLLDHLDRARRAQTRDKRNHRRRNGVEPAPEAGIQTT